MATAPSTLSPPGVHVSAAEFISRYGGRSAELVKGLIEELPTPFQRHGKICNSAAFVLTSHVLTNDLGHVTTCDSFVQTEKDPDTVRGADICYFSFNQIPKGEFPEGLLAIAPELVIEVRSPSDRWTHVIAKVAEYLKVGVRVVIVLDPGTATAIVYRPVELQQIFDNGDELKLPDILPRFVVPVRRLFE